MYFGDKLREVRLAASMTQEQLAKKSRMRLWTLRNHERNVSMIASDDLFRYCKAMTVDCSVFKDCRHKKKTPRR